MNIRQYEKMCSHMQQAYRDFHGNQHMVMIIRAIQEYLKEIWDNYKLEWVGDKRFFKLWCDKGTLKRLFETPEYKIYVASLPKYTRDIYMREIAVPGCEKILANLWEDTLTK